MTSQGVLSVMNNAYAGSYAQPTSPSSARFPQANSPGALDMYSSSQDGIGYVQAASPQPSGFPSISPSLHSMGTLIPTAFQNGFHWVGSETIPYSATLNCVRSWEKRVGIRGRTGYLFLLWNLFTLVSSYDTPRLFRTLKRWYCRNLRGSDDYSTPVAATRGIRHVISPIKHLPRTQRLLYRFVLSFDFMWKFTLCFKHFTKCPPLYRRLPL